MKGKGVRKEISRAEEARGGRVYVCSSVIPANGKTSGIPPGRQRDRRLLMQPLCYIKRNCGEERGRGEAWKSFGRSTLPGADFPVDSRRRVGRHRVALKTFFLAASV